jgi:hypothetical protein
MNAAETPSRCPRSWTPPPRSTGACPPHRRRPSPGLIQPPFAPICEARYGLWEGKKRVEGKANGASRGTEIPTYFSPFCKEIRQLGPAETYVVLRAGLRYFCVIWTRHVAGWPRCGATSNKSCHIRWRISLFIFPFLSHFFFSSSLFFLQRLQC